VNPAAEMILRYRLVISHILTAVDHLEDAGRHVEKSMTM